jgi:hypothetical protein
MGSHNWAFVLPPLRRFRDRLRNHENPWYRSQHPCLHYHVWDSLLANKSAFVILAQDMEMDPVALNLLEAWGALIFQTLPKNDLLDYLPNGTGPLSTGRKPLECRSSPMAEVFRDKTRYLCFHRPLQTKREIFAAYSR